MQSHVLCRFHGGRNGFGCALGRRTRYEIEQIQSFELDLHAFAEQTVEVGIERVVEEVHLKHRRLGLFGGGVVVVTVDGKPDLHICDGDRAFAAESDVGVEHYLEVRAARVAEVTDDVDGKTVVDEIHTESGLDCVNAEDEVDKRTELDIRTRHAVEAHIDGGVESEFAVLEEVGVSALLFLGQSIGEFAVEAEREVAELDGEGEVAELEVFAHHFTLVEVVDSTAIGLARHSLVGRDEHVVTDLIGELAVCRFVGVGIKLCLYLLGHYLLGKQQVFDAACCVFGIRGERTRVGVGVIHKFEHGVAFRIKAGQIIAVAEPRFFGCGCDDKTVFLGGQHEFFVVVRLYTGEVSPESLFACNSVHRGVDGVSVHRDAVEVVDRLFNRDKVVVPAVERKLNLHGRTAADQDVNAAGVGAARDLECGQILELVLGELGHESADEPGEDCFVQTH